MKEGQCFYGETEGGTREGEWLHTQGVFTVVMKNWDPLVLGPALAMERRPGRSWRSLKFSSGACGVSD